MLQTQWTNEQRSIDWCLQRKCKLLQIIFAWAVVSRVITVWVMMWDIKLASSMFTSDKPTRRMIKTISYRKMFLYVTDYLPCEGKWKTVRVQGKRLFWWEEIYCIYSDEFSKYNNNNEYRQSNKSYWTSKRPHQWMIFPARNWNTNSMLHLSLKTYNNHKLTKQMRWM